MVDITTHEEVKSAFNDVYNKLYLQNRMTEERLRTDEEWEFLVEQADNLAKHSRIERELVMIVLNLFEEEEKKLKAKGVG